MRSPRLCVSLRGLGNAGIVQSRLHVRVTEQVLDGLHVGLRANKERSKAVAQVVISESTRVILRQHTGLDRCWSQVIFHQCVRAAWLSALQLHAGKYPVHWAESRATPAASVASTLPAKNAAARVRSTLRLRRTDATMHPCATYVNGLVREVNILPLKGQAF